MNSLPSLLAGLTAILQAHPLCQRIALVETQQFSSDQFFIKVRAELPRANKFQVRIYYNRGHIDYAYQLFSEIPLLRWDNKEEFKFLETYPHHHHNAKGDICASPLSGDPMKDLSIVLEAVSSFLAAAANTSDSEDMESPNE